MNTADVTIISCLYGTTHDRFVDEWETAVKRLDPFPRGITVVACEGEREVLGGFDAGPCLWAHPQAFYLQKALEQVETEWVWVLDIDDTAFPAALAGVELVQADAWMLGYLRSDDHRYLPPQLEPEEVLLSDRNPFAAGSCIRTTALRVCGGFRDLALQDWALWRALAQAGCSFQASDRLHYHYRRHADTRGERELTLDRRDHDVLAMLDAEMTYA